MIKPQRPDYVDANFFNSWWNHKREGIDELDEIGDLEFLKAFTAMVEKIIFDQRTMSAWVQVNKQKKAFMEDFYRMRYDSECYWDSDDERDREIWGAKEGEYLWDQDEKTKTGTPKAGDFCDVVSLAYFEDEGVDAAYWKEVMHPFYVALLQGFGLIYYGDEDVKPEPLLRKANRLKSAVAEMRESLKDLAQTPQYESFFRRTLRRESVEVTEFSNKNSKLSIYDRLDVFEKVSDSYITALSGQTNAGFKPKQYVVRLILSVFHSAIGKGLYGSTAKFASMVIGEDIGKDEVIGINKTTDFSEFTPYMDYPFSNTSTAVKRKKSVARDLKAVNKKISFKEFPTHITFYVKVFT